MNENPNVAQFREGFVENAEPEPIEAPAAEQPTWQPPVDVWPITVKLLHSKKVRNNKGEPISELTFREPTGADINRYGLPVRIDQNGDVVMDERKMTMMMSSLAGVLQPLLDPIDPRDWASCAYRLRSFFLPDPASW
jgi:hypothetical protein